MICSRCGHNPSYFAVTENEFIELSKDKWVCLDCYGEIKEEKRLIDENWKLKQKVCCFENYIKFKSLWGEFEDFTKDGG